MSFKEKTFKKLMVVLLLVLSALFLVACVESDPVSDNRTDETLTQLLSKEPESYVVACFPTEDGKNIVDLAFSVNSSRDTIWLGLEKLLAGAPSDFVNDAIPKGFKLKDLYSVGDVVHIYLTGDQELTIDDINLAAVAGTLSFGLNQQTAEEQPVVFSLYYNDVALQEGQINVGGVNDYSQAQEGVAPAENKAYVYYADSQAFYLVPTCLGFENEVSKQASLEFLDELIGKWASVPPSDSGMLQSLSSGIKYQGLTHDNETLTIDFDGGLMEFGGSSTQEIILLESLQATLRPYTNVDKVYLSVNGKLVNYLPGGSDVSSGLEINHGLGGYNRVDK